LFGYRRPSRVKAQPYECGITPTGDAREPFSVKFYLVAMVFILFDVEAIFLYPWAYIFKDLARNVETRWFGFIEMMMYVAILLVGYIYLWKKGALDWNKSKKYGKPLKDLSNVSNVTQLVDAKANVVVEQLRKWNARAVLQVIEYHGQTTLVVPKELLRDTTLQCR